MRKRISSITEIAKHFEVSPTTVSIILSGQAKRYRISNATTEKIHNYAKKHNFQPNQIARGLRLRKTNTFGLLIPDISNPFFAAVAREVEIEARKHGYAIILCDSEENTSIEKQYLEILASRKVDGIIISPVGIEYEHIADAHEKNIPMIIIDRYFKDLDIPFVANDNYTGAFNAVAHLINNGHKRILCIQGMLKSITNTERVRGYKGALRANNIPIDESLIVGEDYGMENGYKYTSQLLDERKSFTAIFSTSNLISMGSLKAIIERKLRVPEDISIVSFDEQIYLGLLTTPLTTVAQQNDLMGRLAVKNIINIIDKKATTKTESIILPTKLIIRQSVRNLKDQCSKNED